MDTNQTTEIGGTGKWIMWYDLIALLAVFSVLGVGIWWYVSQELLPTFNNQETGGRLSPTAARTVDADVQTLNTQSSSDDVASIDADLKATNLNNLDKELGDIRNTVSQ